MKSKKIRVLHDQSFIDDPTRIIRGLKYTTRLGFELDAETLKLQQTYLENVNYDMCYKRVKNELKLTLGLNSDECFYNFVNQGLYKLIVENVVQLPNLSIKSLINKYQVDKSWLVYLGVVLLQDDCYETISDKLELTKKEKNIVLSAKKLLDVKVLVEDFEIYKAFEGMDVESLLIFAILNFEQNGEAKVARYLDFLRNIKLSVSGKDLLALGVEPSKKFIDAFDYVLKAKLQNPELSEVEEKQLLLEYINSIEM